MIERRPRSKVAQQITGARFAVAAHDGATTRRLRASLSDGVTNGYISSVMVAPAYRRKGIGRAMIERIIGGRRRIRWVLHTRKDARDFYRAVGFEDAPDIIWRDRTGR